MGESCRPYPTPPTRQAPVSTGGQPYHDARPAAQADRADHHRHAHGSPIQSGYLGGSAGAAGAVATFSTWAEVAHTWDRHRPAYEWRLGKSMFTANRLIIMLAHPTIAIMAARWPRHPAVLLAWR
ncbi:hypothetical protein Asi02nite_73420 [Asanoa siamensis]|uniref:Uncharacterized protein n=1 Tax=Asanoa siamensis TaxID=926357 RepID=A0ABQ4D2R1_9ACTN|nr:hypothetical protein Asi02nite_73420 [Asanoa siamensis]